MKEVVRATISTVGGENAKPGQSARIEVGRLEVFRSPLSAEQQLRAEQQLVLWHSAGSLSVVMDPEALDDLIELLHDAKAEVEKRVDDLRAQMERGEHGR